MAGPRVTSEFFVSAYLRLCAHHGAFAALQRRGASEAGAIFILIDRLDGSGTLYGPAPQTSYEERADRAFAKLHEEEALPIAVLEDKLARELRFDPDIWVIAVEERMGAHFLERVV